MCNFFLSFFFFFAHWRYDVNFPPMQLWSVVVVYQTQEDEMMNPFHLDRIALDLLTT